jgi:hypothetical protein
MAIAVCPPHHNPPNTDSTYPIALEVHVTPETLDQLGTGSLRAERVRAAIDFVDLRKLRAVLEKDQNDD